jgi:hypothetical protein
VAALWALGNASGHIVGLYGERKSGASCDESLESKKPSEKKEVKRQTQQNANLIYCNAARRRALF